MRKLIVVALLIILSACEDGGHFLFDDRFDDYIPQSPRQYTVFFETEPKQLAMYEPAHGSFIGIYTDAAPTWDGRTIASHEATLGVRHAAFVEAMELGEDFPMLWVLECIAEQKIPVVVILPPQGRDPFGNQWEEILTGTAKAFSEFPVPMFVIFYPVPANSGWNADTYIAFFRYARALFAAHAPQVAFVWSVDADVGNFTDYFPGALAADWVGFSLFSPMSSESADVMERVLEFYHTFQQDKPIMLNLGLSHFSTDDHRYRIAETTTALAQVYRTILRDFPRVKMVNYMDISRLEYNGHDYRISTDSALQAAYRESVRGFIKESPRSFDDGLFTQPVRSAYTAHVEDGRIYLDARILTEELGLPSPAESRWIGGVRWVDAAMSGMQAEVYDGLVWIR